MCSVIGLYLNSNYFTNLNEHTFYFNSNLFHHKIFDPSWNSEEKKITKYVEYNQIFISTSPVQLLIIVVVQYRENFLKISCIWLEWSNFFRKKNWINKFMGIIQFNSPWTTLLLLPFIFLLYAKKQRIPKIIKKLSHCARLPNISNTFSIDLTRFKFNFAADIRVFFCSTFFFQMGSND